MSIRKKVPHRIRASWTVCVVILSVCVGRALAQPHAIDPLPCPQLGVDALSPLNDTLPGAASSVLKKPGPHILYPGPNLGLNSPDDQLDGLSYDRSPVLQVSPFFLLLFGVDRESVGAVPPDPVLVSLNRPFNVFDQAYRQQQAGDLFLSTTPFTPAGPAIPPGFNPPGRGGNNTLAINQSDTGGVDQDLSPAKAPVQHAPGTSQDNSSNAAYPSGTAKGGFNFLFFSVTSSSPSLMTLPGMPGAQSGADIFVDTDPTQPGGGELYASASSLGLIPTPLGDDIDALVVFDNGNGVLDPGLDEILFSLARGSPTLGDGQFSAADIFVSYGTGTFMLFASAAELGLAPAIDNVDSLEVIPCQNPPDNDIYRHAIFLVWPGDYNQDGTLTEADCAAFPGCYGGEGVPYDTDGSVIFTVLVGPGAVFNPPERTIQVGDAVNWVWLDGPHNVVSGYDGHYDGVFNSGPPAYPPFSFSVIFDEPLLNQFPRPGWVYPYFSAADAPAATGAITVVPHPCAVFDLDFDNDVDCSDWVEFQLVYAQASAGGHCPLLSINEFVLALLGTPVLPAHLCLADMNLDGRLDGSDVQPFVDALLYP